MITRRSFLMSAAAAVDLNDWCAADGSEFPGASWRMEDGMLRCVGGLKTFQDIKTKRLYEDFEFSFEWKMAANGNSGVKYQLERWDKWQPKGLEGFHIRARGPEMQLADDAGPDAAAPNKQCGSLYGVTAPVEKAVVRIGEFNSAKLVKTGLDVEHWINGKKLVSYRLERQKASAIALQNHACDVWFRALAIR